MSKLTLKTIFLSAITSGALMFNPAIAAEPMESDVKAEQFILYVNINTDSLETLVDLLNGVGTKKAQAIIDYRELNGPFQKAEDLINVKGIGAKILERNLNAIKVETMDISAN